MTITDSSTAVTASSTGIVVTANASANTKGSWTELIASTSEETYWIQIYLQALANDESYLIDVGYADVTTLANPVTLISNIYMFGNGTLGNFRLPPMPATVPTTKAFVMRIQTTLGSQTLEAMAYLSNDSAYGTSTANETMGALSASSKGTEIRPDATGPTNNAKGVYFELPVVGLGNNTTTIDYDYIVVCLGNNDQNALDNGVYLVDLATGAAASESVVISNMPHYSSSAELSSSVQGYFQTITSGSEISARQQSSIATVAGAVKAYIDMTIIGFTLTAPAGGGMGVSQGLHTIGSQISA